MEVDQPHFPQSDPGHPGNIDAPSALTPEQEIEAWQRFARSSRGTRSRRAWIAWSFTSLLFIVPIVLLVAAVLSR